MIGTNGPCYFDIVPYVMLLFHVSFFAFYIDLFVLKLEAWADGRSDTRTHRQTEGPHIDRDIE